MLLHFNINLSQYRDMSNPLHTPKSAHSIIFVYSWTKIKVSVYFFPSYHNSNAASSPNYTPNASYSKLSKNEAWNSLNSEMYSLLNFGVPRFPSLQKEQK